MATDCRSRLLHLLPATNGRYLGPVGNLPGMGTALLDFSNARHTPSWDRCRRRQRRRCSGRPGHVLHFTGIAAETVTGRSGLPELTKQPDFSSDTVADVTGDGRPDTLSIYSNHLIVFPGNATFHGPLVNIGSIPMQPTLTAPRRRSDYPCQRYRRLAHQLVRPSPPRARCSSTTPMALLSTAGGRRRYLAGLHERYPLPAFMHSTGLHP